MIYGIGCDLCQVERIKKSLQGPHGASFAARVYGPDELALLGLNGKTVVPVSDKKAGSAAANFAAKEAFMKAAGTGLSGFAMHELQAVRLPGGRPEYRLLGQAAQWLQQNGLRAHLSLSHDGGLAMATCILEQIDA
ncbi:MAG: holo-ACP synthase [Faecalibacterium sp.]|nr:holo-ACP synthase [Faecalibacterium sp.]